VSLLCRCYHRPYNLLDISSSLSIKLDHLRRKAYCRPALAYSDNLTIKLKAGPGSSSAAGNL